MQAPSFFVHLDTRCWKQQKPPLPLPWSMRLLPPWYCGGKWTYPGIPPHPHPKCFRDNLEHSLIVWSRSRPTTFTFSFIIMFHFPRKHSTMAQVNRPLFLHSSPITSCDACVTSALGDARALSYFTGPLPSPTSIWRHDSVELHRDPRPHSPHPPL